MLKDHKVPFISEKILAEFAARFRALARRKGLIVDIVDLIERVLVAHFADKGGLRFEFFERETQFDDPAYVSYRPLTLHVDRRVWAEAKEGGGYAYFVLAHEVAHLLFHDHLAVAFSLSPSSRRSPYVDEERAEWQADTFAKHLTIPDEVFLRTKDARLISALCNIELSVAVERCRSFDRTGPMIKVHYEGDACGECGNFTLVRAGEFVRCDTCGCPKGRSPSVP